MNAFDAARERFARRALSPIWAYAAGFIAACIVASEFIRFAENIAVLWPANGILCVAFFRHRDFRSRMTLACVCVVGNGLVSWLYGHPQFVAAGIAIINVAESYLAARLMERFCPTAFRFDAVSQLWQFIFIAAIGAPVIPSLSAALLFSFAYASSFWTVFSTWLVSDALGMMLVVPAIKLFINRRQHVGFHDTPANIVRILIILALVSTAVFAQSNYPLLFLLFPVLMLVAFQLGPVWSAVATLILSFFAFLLTTQGLGPAALIDGASVGGKIQFVQFFIVVAFLSTLPAAYTLAEQGRLQEQLRQKELETGEARDRAEKAARVKSEFLATMSHEIRTPLTSILGYARLALDRRDDDAKLRNDLRIVEGASRSLLAIVNDILDFSAIEAGRVTLDIGPARLDNVIGDVAQLYAVPAADKGLELSVRIDPDIQGLVVRTDSVRLAQVLGNLVANAVKFTDRGSVRISADVVGPSEAHASVRIAVADTGMGFDADPDQLFQRFSQLDSTRRRKFGGTGLGLAISKSLMMSLGGTIGAESKVGTGSTFWVQLNFERCLSSEPLHPTPTGLSGPGYRLLVVDDVSVNRDLMCEVLRARGHIAEAAASGAEAIERLKREGFDALLMDVQMPEMDGMATTRRIRAYGEPFGSVPIIAVTASAIADEIALCRAAGMDAHVAKPLDWDDFLRTIDAVVKASQCKRAHAVTAERTTA